jgi:hypothetical protein
MYPLTDCCAAAYARAAVYCCVLPVTVRDGLLLSNKLARIRSKVQLSVFRRLALIPGTLASHKNNYLHRKLRSHKSIGFSEAQA